MRVLLVRHGQAVDPYDAGADSLRWLTPKGRTSVRRVAEALLPLGVVPDRVFTSPLVRAVQTAELLVGAQPDFGEPISVLPELSPEEGTTAQVVSFVGTLDPGETIFLVGHEPRIRLIAGHMLGVRDMPAFRTAMACMVATTSGGVASLEWIMDPSTLALQRTLV